MKVWKQARLGQSVSHLVSLVDDLGRRGAELGAKWPYAARALCSRCEPTRPRFSGCLTRCTP